MGFDGSDLYTGGDKCAEDFGNLRFRDARCLPGFRSGCRRLTVGTSQLLQAFCPRSQKPIHTTIVEIKRSPPPIRHVFAERSQRFLARCRDVVRMQQQVAGGEVTLSGAPYVLPERLRVSRCQSSKLLCFYAFRGLPHACRDTIADNVSGQNNQNIGIIFYYPVSSQSSNRIRE